MAFPRFSGADASSQADPLVTSRLTFHSNVPAWVENKEKTEALYNLELRRESKRLSEKDQNDARNTTNDEIRRNREGFKKLWSTYLKNWKERMDRMGKEGMKTVTGSISKFGSQTKQMAGSQSVEFGQSFLGGSALNVGKGSQGGSFAARGSAGGSMLMPVCACVLCVAVSCRLFSCRVFPTDVDAGQASRADSPQASRNPKP